MRDYKSSEKGNYCGRVCISSKTLCASTLYKKIGKNITAGSLAFLDKAEIRPNLEEKREEFVSDSFLNLAETHATKTIDSIKACDFKAKTSEFCKKCDYNRICWAVWCLYG